MPTEELQRNVRVVLATDPAHPPVSLDKFLTEMGLSSVSGWRFRKRGWIKTVNFAGRHYVPHECIVEFNRRAARGEFSRQLSNPRAKTIGGEN